MSTAYKRNHCATFFLCAHYECQNCPFHNTITKHGFVDYACNRRHNEKYNDIFIEMEKEIIKKHGLATYLTFLPTRKNFVGKYTPIIPIEI